MTDIAYEPHPISPERKAELRAQGKKIVDIRFMPDELKDEPQEPKARKKRNAKPKADAASEGEK